MLFYPAALPLPRPTLDLAARVICAYRRETSSRGLRLNSAQQALLVLVCLYKGEPFAEVAAAFEVGTTTAWRYVCETTILLAEQAPILGQGLLRAHQRGWGT